MARIVMISTETDPAAYPAKALPVVTDIETEALLAIN